MQVMLLVVPKACAKRYWCIIKHFFMQINLHMILIVIVIAVNKSIPLLVNGEQIGLCTCKQLCSNTVKSSSSSCIDLMNCRSSVDRPLHDQQH
jgi:hypothetical protein